MRRGYDSTNPDDIPSDAEIIFPYINGIYGPAHASFGVTGWDQTARDRFSHLPQGEISVYPTGEGNIGDVEPGCIWPPEEAIQYVNFCRADGRDPSLYVNASNLSLVRQLIQTAGIKEPHYWIAAWVEGDPPQIPDYAMAVQYEGSAQSHRHVDVSIVRNFWPGVDKMDQADFNALIWRVAIGFSIINPITKVPYVVADAPLEVQPHLTGIITMSDLVDTLKEIKVKVDIWASKIQAPPGVH